MSNAPNEPQSNSEYSDSECRHDRPIAASVEKLRRELDHWLDVAWSQGEKALDAVGLRGGIGWTPAIDVVERGDEVYVYVDIPGVNPQSIELTIAGNMLTLKGEKLSGTTDELALV